MKKIIILLSAYNGEKFISEQLKFTKDENTG